MSGPDDILDFVRVGLALINAYTLFVLFMRFRTYDKSDWNTKSRDLWYSMMMWTLGGMVFCIQAIVLDRPFTFATVFLIASTLVGAKGVHAKGPWGGVSA